MDFRPGDAQLLNNYRIWHARTPYVDFPEPERKRDLYRLWLTLREPLALPDDFQHRRHHGPNGGVRVNALGAAGHVRARCGATPSRLARDAPFLASRAPTGPRRRGPTASSTSSSAAAPRTSPPTASARGAAVHLALTNSPGVRRPVARHRRPRRRGSCRRTRWAQPPSSPGTSAARRRVVGFCATARADMYRAAARTGCRRPRVDEADTDPRRVRRRRRSPSGRSPTCATGRAVMFTSGTTGLPKGVEITQANYAFAGTAMAEARGLGPEHRQLVVLPLFHANAQFYSVASAISVGASVALMHTFSASGFLSQAARHGATHASLFAAPMRMILSRSEPPAGAGRPAALLVRDEHHARPARHAAAVVRLPPPPAVRDDRDAAGRAHRAGRRSPSRTRWAWPTAGCLVESSTARSSLVGGEPGITLFAGYLDDPETTDGQLRPADGVVRHRRPGPPRQPTVASCSTAAAPTC